MDNKLVEIILYLVAALALGIFAQLLASQRQKIKEAVTGLVQRAEDAVQGSKMGQVKKARVIAQLEAMGITVNAYVDGLIDTIVAQLNAKKGWLTEQAGVSK